MTPRSLKLNLFILTRIKGEKLMYLSEPEGILEEKIVFSQPIKMKIKKRLSDKTIFSGNTSLKMVLPCKNEKDNNDNIIKELIAYKIYEILSPFHFKTRRLQIEFNNKTQKGKKKYDLKGFLIEDDDKLAKRFEARIFKEENPLASYGGIQFSKLIFLQLYDWKY